MMTFCGYFETIYFPSDKGHPNVRLEGITSKYEVRFSEYKNEKLLSAEYSPKILRRLTSACSLFSQLPGAWPLFAWDSQRKNTQTVMMRPAEL